MGDMKNANTTGRSTKLDTDCVVCGQRRGAHEYRGAGQQVGGIELSPYTERLGLHACPGYRRPSDK